MKNKKVSFTTLFKLGEKEQEIVLNKYMADSSTSSPELSEKVKLTTLYKLNEKEKTIILNKYMADSQISEFLSDKDYQYRLKDEEVIIEKYIGNETYFLNVPSEINGVKVTAIDERAFYGCHYLKSVVISDSVTYIGKEAFYSCSSLENVIIPDSLTQLDDTAFDVSLKRIYGVSNSYAKKYAKRHNVQFIECAGLDSLSYKLGVEHMEITEYTGKSPVCIIPQKINDVDVTVISGSAFKNGSMLKFIILPETLIRIEDFAFAWCKSLISINIPENVSYIGQGVFRNCESLQCITVSKKNKNYCVAGNGILFDSNMTELIKYPSKLNNTSYKIPASVEIIRGDAFFGCEHLEAIDVEPDNKNFVSINGVLFNHYKDVLLNRDKNVLIRYPAQNKQKAYIIPDGVTSIQGLAFEGCRFLQEITIPDTVTEFGVGAFENCSAIKDIVIPESVTEMDAWVFRSCTSLKKIVIPNSVTEIGKGSFCDCSLLKSVVIADGVIKINDGAFLDCTSLESVSIPNSITEIGIGAFMGCRSLKNVVIPNSVTEISYIMFSDCIFLENVVIPDSVTWIGNYAFENCSSLKSIVIPNGVTDIGEGAFKDCFLLESVFIPKSVVTIAENAFQGCKSLTIYGPLNSVAKKYAKKNNISFKWNR